MKYRIFSLAITLAFSSITLGQTWPNQITQEERDYIERIGFEQKITRGITSPPDYDNLRAAAEWEEIEALTIAWEGFECILKQITAAAVSECKVIIFTETPNSTSNYLTGNSCGGPVSLENVEIVNVDLNSIWIRDYGANTVYGSWNDDRILVDWMYNRPRPYDDVIPDELGQHMGIDVYSTTAEPNDLMNTGGNYMSDGFGLAFESELIIDENNGDTNWWTTFPNHTVLEIENILEEFMGIETLVTMETLPFDGIHHIDMHMKLLDESTLLVSEYPDGLSDGPQINANIDYILSNFSTKWGTPFDVIRIPSPPSTSGAFPGSQPELGNEIDGYYRTYSNAVFVNNTVILPTYYEQYDTTAIRIWENALPGYNIVGIDCDSGNNNIISQSGAIHCITHSVGVEDPLIISHLPLDDTENTTEPYAVEGYLSHRSGISTATLIYATSPDGPWTEVSMSDSGNGEDFTAEIPAQDEGTTVYYYIQGEAESGKVGNRPMPAPEGWWKFNIGESSLVGVFEGEPVGFSPIYPNPAAAITCVPVQLVQSTNARVVLRNVHGANIEILHDGILPRGKSKLFFDASQLSTGAYVVTLELEGGFTSSQRVMVK